MIENPGQMKMRAGASRRLVESTCPSDVKSSIAGVVGSPNQLSLTPRPGFGFHPQQKTGKSRQESYQYIEIKR
jgi:hypothetical protein